MLSFYDRHRQGFHQEVYDELMALDEQVFEVPLYEDALFVAREIMRRVRHNLKLLIPRLQKIGYRFGEGVWDDFDDLSADEKAHIQQDIPIFKTPTPETANTVLLLEQRTGTLPLALRCWYEEVGCVNLIGLFPPMNSHAMKPDYGSILDPLFVYSVDMALSMVQSYMIDGAWSRNPVLPLSPDQYYKYSLSGSGTYAIRLPCRTFDAPLLLERHHTTFVSYLRICLHWGGFLGLKVDNRVSYDTVEFLTKDFLRF